MKLQRSTLVLFLLFCLGFSLRFSGLTRGSADITPRAEQHQSSPIPFYHFHPDETTLLAAALKLDNPLRPPLTVYGMLPLYVLRTTFEVTTFCFGWTAPNFDDPDSARRLYYIARTLAALISCATLFLVWLLGTRYLGPAAGLVAACCVALAPLALQQAHFFTVDGLFTLLSLATVYALLRSLESSRLRGYALTGLLIGATGAVRYNGLLLGLVVLAALFWKGRSWHVLRGRPLWLCGLTALATVLALHPFILTDPGLLSESRSSDGLQFSLQVARGEVLRSWTLVDVHTWPYVHFWTHLWPLAVGWPLTLVFALSVGYALWQRGFSTGLLLLWCGLYFGPVGGLHAKHVRYLLPLLPFLSLLSGDLCVAFWRRWRWAGYGVCVSVLLYTGVYGVAFARLYSREDSRIEAARWIASSVPEGSLIGVERGGFSMRPLIRPEHHPISALQTITLFEGRGYMTCQAAVTYLQRRHLDVDYIAIIDVNRYQQFTAVPELLPVAAEFYHRLVDGKLGFDLVRRFKQYPSLGGIEFNDDGAEPSFIGFDHPAVLLFKRRDQSAVEQSLARWREDLQTNPSCPDLLLQEAVTAMQANNDAKALKALQHVRERFPRMKLVHFLEAEVQERLGRPVLASLEAYVSGFKNRLFYMLPLASGMSLTELGRPDLAVAALKTTGKARYHAAWTHPDMADVYVELANLLYERKHLEYAQQVYALAAETHPNAQAYNRLAYIAYGNGQFEEAVDYWMRSLEIDGTQTNIHSNLGQVSLKHLLDNEKALYHFNQVVELDPRLEAEMRRWIEQAQ